MLLLLLLFVFCRAYLILFEISFLKSKISKLKYRLNNTKTKLKNLDKIKHIRFNKNTKYNSYLISGRSDGAYKNFVFKAMPHEKDNYYLFLIF